MHFFVFCDFFAKISYAHGWALPSRNGSAMG
jgi:hypothetical protein